MAAYRTSSPKSYLTVVPIIFLFACQQQAPLPSQSGTRSDENKVTAAAVPENTMPPPEPDVIDGYLVGRRVAELYGQHDWCYNHDASGPNCTRYESLISRSASQLQIRSRIALRLRAGSPESIGEAFVGAITKGTELNPDGIWIEETQTFEITLEGLCRSREQNINDAYMTNYRWVTNFGPNGRQVELTDREREERRRLKAEARSRQISGRTCWRYAADPANPRRITGSRFIDGIRQPGNDDYVYLTERDALWRIRES